MFANLVFCNNQKANWKHLVYNKNSSRQVLQCFHKILVQMSSGGMKKMEKKKKPHNLYVFLNNSQTKIS